MDADTDHSLPHVDEARIAAQATAFGMVDYYKETTPSNGRAGGDEENGGAASDGVYSIDHDQDDHDDDEAEEEEDDEDAPINPTAANKEKRKQRYFCSYLLQCFLVILRCCAVGIAAVALVVGIYFLVREILHVRQLGKDNTDMAAQISDMEERIELLKQGILEPPPLFQPEQLKCDLLSDQAGTYGDASDPNLPGFYGCVSNDAASTLVEAQNRVQKWSEVEAPSDMVDGTPEWIKRRVPDYGIWLYPRLKLVLLSCPKCGNAESRTMLTVLSSMRQRTHVGDANLEDVINWTTPVGSWEQESTDSWRLAGTFKGPGNKGMSGGDEDTVAAFQLIHELMVGEGNGNGGKWSSLAIVRHPYERFVDAYAELEALWSRLPDNSPQRQVLDSRPFSKVPVGSWERVRAFFADYVLGYLSAKDGASNCLVLTLPELYNVVPTVPGYWRTGTGSGFYYSAQKVISIDQIHSAWPDLLQSWGFDSKDPALVELADVHVNAGGGSSGYGYYSASDAAKAARDLLASDEEFRDSVDAFYAQDFSCFGFQRGQEVLGVPVVENPSMKQKPPPQPIETPPPTLKPTAAKTVMESEPPTLGPTAAKTALESEPEDKGIDADENAAPNTPGNGRERRREWIDNMGNLRF